MSSNAVCGAETRTRKRARERDTNPQEAFPGLPQDVVVTHILRFVPDTVVLARLRAVNRAMRDAVERRRGKTGLSLVRSRFRSMVSSINLLEEMNTEEAAELGYLDTLQHLLQKGRLNKAIVCRLVAKGGHLEVLQWARANGCPWDGRTCDNAKKDGHLDMLQWAIANGCPWVDQFET